MPSALFQLGNLVATPGAIQALSDTGVSPASLLARHVTGDWGDLCDEDKLANDHAVMDGSRILSAYTISPNHRIWIISESDRSSSTLLLPEEY